MEVVGLGTITVEVSRGVLPLRVESKARTHASRDQNERGYLTMLDVVLKYLFGSSGELFA